MHHLFVRLQLTWLTFAAIVAATMVTTLGPRGGGVDVHFALSSQQFRDGAAVRERGRRGGRPRR